MSDLMEDGGGIPMHSPARSPTLQRAVRVPTADSLGDLTLSVVQTKAQHAQTTQHMHAMADFLAGETLEGGRPPEYHGEPARFNGRGDAKAWLRTLALIFDAKA